MVDDEPMMTEAAVRMLKPSGHLVSVAGSGEEALEKLAEQTFDLVVSDVGMGTGTTASPPRFRGLQLATRINNILCAPSSCEVLEGCRRAPPHDSSSLERTTHHSPAAGIRRGFRRSHRRSVPRHRAAAT